MLCKWKVAFNKAHYNNFVHCVATTIISRQPRSNLQSCAFCQCGIGFKLNQDIQVSHRIKEWGRKYRYNWIPLNIYGRHHTFVDTTGLRKYLFCTTNLGMRQNKSKISWKSCPDIVKDKQWTFSLTQRMLQKIHK